MPISKNIISRVNLDLGIKEMFHDKEESEEKDENKDEEEDKEDKKK